jgi:YHS domain-containing protein
MDMLVYVALWAVIIWLMSRVAIICLTSEHLQTSKGTGASDNLKLRWVPPVRDSDPVCGKMITTDRAKPSVYDGNVYYFCSRECREVFEAAPNLYLGNGDAEQQKLEHSHA